ncbi:MAG: SBBP repeat-containing protein [Bacteroidia bacterium]|nr:SBBP repeat-containing protein [Bacteroidia bacterium]
MTIKVLISSILITSATAIKAQSFEWAVHVGGSSADYGNHITVDASRNAYVTGYFNGTGDFDPGPGVYNLTSNGGSDSYICKLDPYGNLIWARQLGGALNEYSDFITVGNDGSVYTTGNFSGTADFDPGMGVYNLAAAGGQDIYISKLDASGNFIWAKSAGNTGTDLGTAIALDTYGNVYATGKFTGTVDFDPGTGVYNLAASGLEDIFVLKLDASGNFGWAKKMGGTSSEVAMSITIDAFGNVITTGYFRGTADFDPGSGTANLSSFLAGSDDVFVSRLDSTGAFRWACKAGNNANDRAYSVRTDNRGNVYSTGYFQGIVDFDPGSGTTTLSSSSGGEDVYIWKLDSAGALSWALKIGGINVDAGRGITIDDSGYVYTTGHFNGVADFDPGSGTYNVASTIFNSSYTDDAFISKLDSSGNFVWAKKLGGIYADYGRAVAVDTLFGVYTAGYFVGTVDFDPDMGVFNIASYGNQDAFVQKMRQCSATYSNIVLSACDSLVSPSGLYTWMTSGQYMDTLYSVTGCDSIITVNLTINSADVSVLNNDPTLTANAVGALYQWIDCNNGYAVITGQTFQNFTPPVNGNYAVIVTQNNCTDTSLCYAILTTHYIKYDEEGKCSVFPNPSDEGINIRIPKELIGSIYYISDVNGETLLSGTLTGENTALMLHSLSNGTYLISIGDYTKLSFRFIKQ